MKNNMWSSSFCVHHKNIIPILGKPTDQSVAQKRAQTAAVTVNVITQDCNALAGLFGETCITSVCNMHDSNQHSSTYERWWLFKSKINLVVMQANGFSWVPIQICLKQQKTHILKDIYFVFAKYFYHGCDLFSFNLFLVFWSHSDEPSSSESSLWRQRDCSGTGTDVVKNPCSLLWTFLVVYSHYVSGVGNM